MKQLPTIESNRIAATRLRAGKHGDLPAIARLIARVNVGPHMDEHELEAVTDRGRLIVLPLGPTEIAAAACVAPGRGVVFLVIDPAVASAQLEQRMIGVADALSESEPVPGGGSARAGQ